MIIHTLAYEPSEAQAENSVPMTEGLQALRCADTPGAQFLGRALQAALLAQGATGAPLPAVMNADLPGPCRITATLATNKDDATDNAAVCPVGDSDPNAPGADLLLISLTDISAAGTDLDSVAREMAAVLDTGNSRQPLTDALARLDDFAVLCGRGNENDSLLAKAKEQLKALQAELTAAKEAEAQAAQCAAPLRESREQALASRTRRAQLEKLCCASVLHHVTRCQDRLEGLFYEISEAEKRPCVDTEQAAAIQRAETITETARLQYERTREALRAIIAELDGLQDAPEDAPKSGEDTATSMRSLEQQIRTGAGRITEFNARLDEVNTQIATLDEHVAAAQEQLATLPDFTRIAPNPVDWLAQLARSFKTALSTRDNEEETRDAMREELAELRVEIAGDAPVFEDSANFAEELITHQNKKKYWETKTARITEETQRDRSIREELLDRIPGLFLLSLGCGLFLSLLLGAYWGLQKTPILYPTALILISALYFITQLVVTRSRVTHLTHRIAEGQAEMDVISDEEKNSVSQIDRLMARAGCATPRELEARYDRYRDLRNKLTALETRFRQQENHLRESEERIPKLFERVRGTLEQVDETPSDEGDVENAVGRAIAKYQVFRETKRRLADLRNQHQGLLNRKRFLEREIDKAQETVPELEQKLRGMMRAKGFVAEAGYPDITAALAAYARHFDTLQETAEQRMVLAGRRKELEAQLPDEAAVYEQHRRTLEQLLEQAHFDSAELAREAAANTLALHDMEQEKQTLEQRLTELLQGRAPDTWRKLAGDTTVSEDDQGPEQHRRELESAEQEREEALRRYRNLRQERLQLLAAQRPPYEIEEDLAETEKQIASLRRDISAAAHAMTLIEESARDWRVRCAEIVSERASEILDGLGMTALLHLVLEPDAAPVLELVAETDSGAVDPAALLFALRLAAVETLADADASCPLIIDAASSGAPSPLPLEKVLGALAATANRRQVLLLFDGDDMADAVAAKELPVTVL